MLESTIKVDDELALKYLQDIMGKMEIIDVLSTSNMYLNYLIHSKVEKIKSLNIDLTCGFKNTLDFLNLFELTTILGNLIDNAIRFLCNSVVCLCSDSRPRAFPRDVPFFQFCNNSICYHFIWELNILLK